MLNLPLGVDIGAAPPSLLMPDMMPKHPAVNARYESSRSNRRMATHAYFEKQRQNIIVVRTAKIWSDESLSLAHTHKVSAQGFSVLKYKSWALSLDLPGSPCGCSTQYFRLCFCNQTLFLKMPITCKTNDNSREVCSNSSQRNKWSSYQSVMDSTSEAHDASTGMGGLILPNK